MAGADKEFVGSIPAIYDHYLVPLLFEPYARDLARRVGALPIGRLLEIAAGTGAVTRELARTLPSTVEIVATDLNQPMLDRAAAHIGDGRVQLRLADVAALPFPDGAFDVAVCQFGVMFFPDKVAALAEVRRVLAPGGRFIFSVWDGLETNELTRVAVEAVARLFPGDPPRFLERTPHGYHDLTLIRRALAAAGYDGVAIEMVDMHSRAPSARAAAIGLCQGTPLRGEIEGRGAGGLDKATDVATAALEARYGDGPIDAPMRAFVVTASN